MLKYFRQVVFVIVLSFIAGFFLLMSTRIIFSIKILEVADFANFKADYFFALLTGFRFDAMVLCYLMLLPLLIMILSTLTFKYSLVLKSLAKNLTVIILFLVSVICAVDFYYYDYFQSHISVLAFGLFEDDTKAVLSSVWSDYPVLRLLFLLVLIFVLIRWVVNIIFSVPLVFSFQSSVFNKIPTVVVVILFLGFYVLGMRGSLGTFPLQIDDATVSANSKINLLPVNGVYAIKEACRARTSQWDFAHDLTIVKSLGYNDAQIALADYLEIPVDSIKKHPDFFNLLFTITVTDSFIEKNPPNIVFFQMESMSNYNLNFHSPTLNLYGDLEKHVNEDYFFRKFVSCANGTINSLEGLMVSTPVTSIAQSQYCKNSYSSSIAKPFSEKGYETTYITGGKSGWRNIEEFIPLQFFENVENKNNVMSRFKDATECEWGVFDEYLFDYVFEKLNEGIGKPQLIFAMTTTNHTPFNLPVHYQPYSVNLPDSVKSKILTSEEIAVKNLTNLQYSNDCLGKFMNKIKNSPLAENTIVAATGDHNNLMLFSFSENQLAQKLGVPLYMYVPEQYKPNHPININQWASHRDIFPTLINLSLSGAKYFNSGRNLFSKANDSKSAFAINYGSMVAINDSGSVMFAEPAQLYFHSKVSANVATASENESLKELSKKARVYYSAMYYFIINESLKR